MPANVIELEGHKVREIKFLLQKHFEKIIEPVVALRGVIDTERFTDVDILLEAGLKLAESSNDDFISDFLRGQDHE